jgi:hypothetical protein
MFTRFSVLALLGLMSSPAFAEWSARVEGPDVFGNTTVHASEMSIREGLVVQCDQNDQLNIAWRALKKLIDRCIKTATKRKQSDFVVLSKLMRPSFSTRKWASAS